MAFGYLDGEYPEVDDGTLDDLIEDLQEDLECERFNDPFHQKLAETWIEECEKFLETDGEDI
jgi:hypothetical protein